MLLPCWKNVSPQFTLQIGMELMDVGVGSGFPRPSSKVSTKTFISLPDKGLLKRFTADPQHPQSVAPPTETSLRDAISRSERASSTNSFGLSEWRILPTHSNFLIA